MANKVEEIESAWNKNPPKQGKNFFEELSRVFDRYKESVDKDDTSYNVRVIDINNNSVASTTVTGFIAATEFYHELKQQYHRTLDSVIITESGR